MGSFLGVFMLDRDRDISPFSSFLVLWGHGWGMEVCVYSLMLSGMGICCKSFGFWVEAGWSV